MSGSATVPQKQKFDRKRKRSRRDDGEKERVETRQAKPQPPPDQVDESIRHMDRTLLADLFAQKIRRHMRELTTVEVSDLQVPATAFSDTSLIDSPRSLNKLPAFLEQCSGGREELSTTSEATASPHTVVIASSGIRAADITRTLRPFQSKTAAVSKLFAKHIKLAESIKLVTETRIGIGVGTPQRVLDLLLKDALKVDNLRQIVIDASYQDQKKRSILDYKEIFIPLARILGHEDVKARLDSLDVQSRTQLLVF